MSSDKNFFDSERYAHAYPDVAQSGLTPHDHYERYGRLLGRNPMPTDDEFALCSETNAAELDRAYAQGPLPVSGIRTHDDLVSVIMPSYNNVEWIARAIHSVLSQRSVNVELIVVDDGSTDGSVEVARKIAADYPNVRVISLLRNFGCYYARNIGVSEARGTYITTVDSDDIISPDRILRQLNALKANSEKRACLARTRRWSENMSLPLSEARYAENTLLWKRSVVDEIGYYDTVRFGGDTEFRVRIETVFGKASVLRIPDEVYFLRTLDTSLTTATGSVAYTNVDGVLQPSLSDDRKRYSDNLNGWLKEASTRLNDGQLPMLQFPQFSRPFSLGSPTQNASPSLGQRRVGAMASFPLRSDSLEASIASVLPQLDLLILYLNDYDKVPDFAHHPKIRAISSQNAVGDLRDNGKFYALPQDDCSYVFTFDDDLIYPPDYTARMIHQIELLGRSCVVGVHGVIFPYDDFTQLSQRKVFHFMHQTRGTFVDLIGTGTAAWHSSLLKPTLEDFKTRGICDLWFTALCIRNDIPLYSVPRRHKWVDEFAKYQISLWKEVAEQPHGYFEIYESVVEPVLKQGQVRRAAETQMAWAFPADILAAAEVDLQEAIPMQALKLPRITRQVAFHSSPYGAKKNTTYRPHFHLVLSGYNSCKMIDKTLQSVVGQKFGCFTCDVTMVDDGSTDRSFDKLAAVSILPEGRLLAVTDKTGSAYGRDLAIQQIQHSDTMVVPITFGDILAESALADLARHLTAYPALDIGLCSIERNKRVLAFRRNLYNPGVDEFRDNLGHWIDDNLSLKLTQHVMRDIEPDRVLIFKSPFFKINDLHQLPTREIVTAPIMEGIIL